MDGIKNVVNEVIKKFLNKEIKQYKKIDGLWNNILEKNELKHTKVGGIKKEILFIYVDSPVWLYQMNIKKKGILKKIKEAGLPIKEIIFRIGKVK